MRQLLAKPRRCRRPPRLARTIKPLASNVAKAVAVCDLPTLHMSAAIRTEQSIGSSVPMRSAAAGRSVNRHRSSGPSAR